MLDEARETEHEGRKILYEDRETEQGTERAEQTGSDRTGRENMGTETEKEDRNVSFISSNMPYNKIQKDNVKDSVLANANPLPPGIAGYYRFQKPYGVL